MKKITLPAAIAVIFALLSGCGGAKYEPTDIVKGVDICEVCNMEVPDDHNATEIILKDGKVLKFDDLGDLYVWKKEHGTGSIGAEFVRDYATKGWIKLSDASYAYDPTFATPMGYGVYSFKDKAEAQAFIDKQGTGKLMSASDLDAHGWQRASSGHMHGEEGQSPEKTEHHEGQGSSH